MPRRLLIAPSILAGDFGHLAQEAKRAEIAGADWLHVDVMDGHFVPNLTLGPDAVRALRKATSLPLDVHLMIVRPDRFASEFLSAGADILSIHVESPCDVRATLAAIRAARKKAGLVFNPDTPARAVEPLLDSVDLVLAMTVNPGFGGQGFIEPVLEKVREVAAFREDRKLEFNIEVDGGVSDKTAAACVAAGANVLVAGTALFRAPDMSQAMARMRRACGARG